MSTQNKREAEHLCTGCSSPRSGLNADRRPTTVFLRYWPATCTGMHGGLFTTTRPSSAWPIAQNQKLKNKINMKKKRKSLHRTIEITRAADIDALMHRGSAYVEYVRHRHTCTNMKGGVSTQRHASSALTHASSKHWRLEVVHQAHHTQQPEHSDCSWPGVWAKPSQGPAASLLFTTLATSNADGQRSLWPVRTFGDDLHVRSGHRRLVPVHKVSHALPAFQAAGFRVEGPLDPQPALCVSPLVVAPADTRHCLIVVLCISCLHQTL